MRLRDFRKAMKKNVFSLEEARVVAFQTNASVLKLQLHQWTKSGELIRIKRGLYAFSAEKVEPVEIAKALCAPCYVSLESALNAYGLIPDVPFALTLVTPKTAKVFATPFGQFSFQKIKLRAFGGFDAKSLMAEKEKALLDYLYLNKRRLVGKSSFWREARFQNLNKLSFRRMFDLAKLYEDRTIKELLVSLKEYAKSA